MNQRQETRHNNKLASAICAAMGMPSRFAVEKPPVSSTLRASLKSYMQGLSGESLQCISVHGPKLSKQAAAAEIARRAEGKEVARD